MAKNLNIIKDLRDIYNNLEEKEIVYKSSLGEYTIKVKQYLPYEQKKMIVDTCIEGGVDVDVKTVLPKFERDSMRIIKEYLIVKQYTDIPVLEDILETYDLITSCELKDFIMENIPSKELEEIESAIDYGIKEFERLQEVSGSLGNKLESLLSKINDDLATTIGKLSYLDVNEIVAKQNLIKKQNEKLKK